MKIAVITTSRADWNPLGMVAKALRDRGETVDVIAVGHHAGLEAIRADGFEPRLMPTHLGGIVDQASAIMRGVRTAFYEQNPDMAVILGDRWETLTVAVACSYMSIPIAHLAGGDITEGSKDNDYRHAITKLAHLHFPTHEAARERLIQMGEEPSRVFNYGSPSIDRILSLSLMSREEVTELFTEGHRPLILANWQDETLGDNSGLSAMLEALAGIDGTVTFVAAGADARGEEINTQIKRWVDAHPKSNFFDNLSPQAYLSVMKHCDLMIGNSSSAFYEAPTFGTPAIDIGRRQAGRLRPQCVVNVTPGDGRALKAIIRNLLTGRFAPAAIYGDGRAAEKIARRISAVGVNFDPILLQKKFHAVV